MNCPDCTEAARRKWSTFTAGCTRCTARAVSRSDLGRRAVAHDDERRAPPGYQDLLRRFAVTHLQVRLAALADYQHMVKP